MLFENFRTYRDRRKEEKCPFCGKDPNVKGFKDELSMKEYEISGLCQDCQDEVFREPDEEDDRDK